MPVGFLGAGGLATGLAAGLLLRGVLGLSCFGAGFSATLATGSAGGVVGNPFHVGAGSFATSATGCLASSSLIALFSALRVGRPAEFADHIQYPATAITISIIMTSIVIPL